MSEDKKNGWELIAKQSGRRSQDPQWFTNPAVHINKTCLSFNQAAMRIFNLRKYVGVEVYINVEAEKLAFKPVSEDDEMYAAYRFVYPGSEKTTAPNIGCQRILSLFEDLPKPMICPLSMEKGGKLLVADYHEAIEKRP